MRYSDVKGVTPRFRLYPSTGFLGFLKNVSFNDVDTRHLSQHSYLRSVPNNTGTAKSTHIVENDELKPINNRAVPVHLNATELGVVKVVNSYIIVDVKRILSSIYGAGSHYSTYTSSAVQRLLEELDECDSGVLPKAYRAFWPTASAVVLARAYQALMNILYRRKAHDHLLGTFVDLLDHPMLLRSSMFHLASLSAYYTYVDGWVIPLLLMNAFLHYGPKCFMLVPTFTDFSLVAQLPTPSKSDIPKKKDLFIDFKCVHSKKQRLLDITLFHNSVMQACIHSREFKTFIALYFNNLSVKEDIERGIQINNCCDFTVTDVDPSALLSGRTNGRLHGFVHSILNKTDKIKSVFQLKSPSLEVVKEDKEGINNIKAGNVCQLEGQWAMTLMLKHALHNLFMSVDIVKAYKKEDEQSDEVDVSRLLSPYSNIGHLGEYPVKYYQALINKQMFRKVEQDKMHTANEFMNLLNDTDATDGERRSEQIVEFIHKPLKETFMRNTASEENDRNPSLNSTIRELKNNGMSLEDLGIVGIYAAMRRLLSFGISGAVAVKLFAMIYPEARFKAWCHYHLFLCSFECDLERRDIASLDALMDLMNLWRCGPEPAMYALFFDLCASNGRDDLILRHAQAYMNERKSATAIPLRSFGLKNFNRVSFEMYTHLLSSYKRMARYNEGLLAFKQLLADVNGVYRSIPLTVWHVLRAIVEECDAPGELRVLVEQCEELSKSVDVSKVLATHARNADMYSRNIIATELELLIDRVVSIN